MKKSLIAGAGAAAFAFAALPLAGGAFAGNSTMTDTINVTIDPACTIVNDNTDTEHGSVDTENTYTVKMKNGQVKTDIGTSDAQGDDPDNTISVSCNVPSGGSGSTAWTLTAAGKDSSTALSNGSTTIPAGTATSGSTSAWAYKVTSSDENVNFGQFDSTAYHSLATDTNIATGTGSASFTMLYQVYVSATQDSGNYTGGIVYTLANPQS